MAGVKLATCRECFRLRFNPARLTAFDPSGGLLVGILIGAEHLSRPLGGLDAVWLLALRAWDRIMASLTFSSLLRSNAAV